MRPSHASIAILAVLALAAAPAAAQTAVRHGSRIVRAPAPPGPGPVTETASGARALEPRVPRVSTRLSDEARRALLDAGAVRAPFQARNSGGIPYMVAGGALFVAGAIVGDTAGTLMMVGGAGVGAYGLFVYYGGEVE